MTAQSTLPVATLVAESQTVQIAQKKTFVTRMIRTDVYFGPTKLATIRAGETVSIQVPGEGMLTLNSSQKYYPRMGSILMFSLLFCLIGPFAVFYWYAGGQPQSLTIPAFQNAPKRWRVEYDRRYKMTVTPES